MEYNSVTFAAYLSAAAIGFLLTLTYVYQRYRAPKHWFFAYAAAFHTGHLALIAYALQQTIIPVSALIIAEVLHYNLWIYCIARSLQHTSGRSQLPSSLRFLFFIGWPISGIVIATCLIGQVNQKIFTIWGALTLAVIALVSVEQLFRFAADNDRQIKLLCLNLTAIFLFDIYLFTHALIFHGIDPLLWQSRAAVSMVACLFMALGGLLLLQQSDRSANLTVSRPIAFYTTSLVAAGLLITLLAFGGYYVQSHGGSWGTVLYSLLLAAAVILIGAVFCSSRLRMHLSVLINKHLFRYKYDYRSEWLRLINYLAQYADPSEVNSRAFYAVSSTTHAPGGAIWLRKQGFYEPVYRHAIPDSVQLNEVPITCPFCRTFIDAEWVFVPDAGEGHPLSQHNELLPSWVTRIPDLWLLFPLIVGEELVGFIALTKPAGDTSLTWEDLDLLKTMGRQIGSYLKRHQQAERLAEGRQFDTYNKLVAFIIHDLNNLIAQQALVVRNAEKHKNNPAFIDDAIITISNSVDRMNNLLAKLKRNESDYITRQNISDVVTNAIDTSLRKGCVIEKDIELSKLDINADQTRLVMSLANFIKNGLDATPDNGRVHVKLRVIDDRAIITIEDNGVGMDWDFIQNRLFKPFETTKSGKGMGIGAYLAREYISELNGTLNVASKLGQGTLITITLPLNKDEWVS